MRKILVLLLVSVIALALAPGSSLAGKPTIAGPCAQCHQGAADVVRGTLVGVSDKFRTLQVAVGNVVWVIGYGDDVKLKGAESLAAIPAEKEVAVTFSGPEKSPRALAVSVKPPYNLPAEKIVSAEEVAELVKKSPEEGGYLLFDARPWARYAEGHIPHAVAFPFPDFDKLAEKLLPKDKGKLIVFYCGGET